MHLNFLTYNKRNFLMKNNRRSTTTRELMYDFRIISEVCRDKSKEYFNSKNRSKMQMPKLGVDPDAFSRHGGAGPRGKFLKRI